MIEMGKQYRTRDGRRVRILCVDANSGYRVVGLINENNREVCATWDQNGAFKTGVIGPHDAIEVQPHEDWPIDAPVWVRNSDVDRWRPRHFRGIECNFPTTWNYKGTSFSCPNSFATWEQARLASEFTPAPEERGE